MLCLPPSVHPLLRARLESLESPCSMEQLAALLSDCLKQIFGAESCLVAIERADRERPGDGVSLVLSDRPAQGASFIATWQELGIHQDVLRDLKERMTPFSYSSFSWPYSHSEADDADGFPKAFTLFIPMSSRLVVHAASDEPFQGYVALMFPEFPTFAEELVQLVITLSTLLSEILLTCIRSEAPARDALGGFAHNVKQQLLAAKEMVPRIRRKRMSEEDNILSSLLRVLSRVELEANSILLCAKEQDGMLRPRPLPSSLNEVVLSCVERLRPLCDARGLKLKVELEDKLPSVALDPALFPAVVDNLLDNAVKYSAEKGVIAVITRSESSQTVALEIVNEGKGLCPAGGELLFSKYFRGPNAQGISGSGLGLYLAKQLVEGHQGRIFAYRERDAQTSFVVELPVFSGCDTPLGERERSRQESAES